MRKIACLAVALCALLAASAGAEPEKGKGHGYSVSGTIVRVDEKAKTFTVLSGSTREVTLVRTSATRITGSKLQAGERVTARWIDRNGKKIATAVRVEPAVLATATPAAAVRSDSH
jgi:ribosomal protein L16/L10AE